jgi:hypothetical protein
MSMGSVSRCSGCCKHTQHRRHDVVHCGGEVAVMFCVQGLDVYVQDTDVCVQSCCVCRILMCISMSMYVQG